jgi:hypothetical protein
MVLDVDDEISSENELLASLLVRASDSHELECAWRGSPGVVMPRSASFAARAPHTREGASASARRRRGQLDAEARQTRAERRRQMRSASGSARGMGPEPQRETRDPGTRAVRPDRGPRRDSRESAGAPRTPREKICYIVWKLEVLWAPEPGPRTKLYKKD